MFKSKMAAGPDTIFGFERRAKNTGKRVSFPDLNILCFRPSKNVTLKTSHFISDFTFFLLFSNKEKSTSFD